MTDEMEFQEALQNKNEQTIERQKQALRDATAVTRVQAEQTTLNEEMFEHIEESVDKVVDLKKSIRKKQIIFGITVFLIVVVIIARFVAWQM